MSYVSSNLYLLSSSPSPAAVNQWQYLTTDTFATTVGSNYFADGAIRGMLPGDFITVIVYTTDEGGGNFTGFSSNNLANVSATSGLHATIAAVSTNATEMKVGTTTIDNGTSGFVLYDNGGVLGELSVPATARVFTAQQNFGTATLTDGSTINWNVASAQVAKVTIAGSRTMAAPTNQVDGGTYILRVIQGSGGSHLITWDGTFKWPGGTAPTLSTSAGAVDIISFVSDGTNMNGVAQLAFS